MILIRSTFDDLWRDEGVIAGIYTIIGYTNKMYEDKPAPREGRVNNIIHNVIQDVNLNRPFWELSWRVLRKHLVKVTQKLFGGIVQIVKKIRWKY